MERVLLIVIVGGLAIGGCGGTTTSDGNVAAPTEAEATTGTSGVTTDSTVASTTKLEANTTQTSTSTVIERTPGSSSKTEALELEWVELEIVSREGWRAKEPDRPMAEHEIDQITLHHTARAQDDSPMPDRLRRWQDYHQSLGWGDIAYHMVIARDGTIYAGRDWLYAGDTRTSYDPTGHFLPALDGMFDEYWDSPNDNDEEPDGADDLTFEQFDALISLLAWATKQFDIEPEEISGHRDYASTSCPGSVVQRLIDSGDLAALVAERAEYAAIDLVYSPQERD